LLQFQLLFSSAVNIIQFLSLFFEGSDKWFFVDYILNILLVVAIAVTAVFDNHLEINMGNQRIEGRASLDSSDCRWYCYNTNHVYAGLIGSGIFRLIANGGSSSAVVRLTSNPSVMVQFIPHIVAFAGLRRLGVIAGSISYISTYLQN
jgi:hypothetical protein